MLKFFRRYNKRILAIVTAFLMIAFVGGQALTTILAPQPGRDVFATAFGEELIQADQIAMDRETELLSRLARVGLFVPWQQPWGGGQSFGLEPLKELDYLLLVREAEMHGAKPDPAQARARLERVSSNMAEFRLNTGYTSNQIESALANFILVQQLWQAAAQSVAPSELEVQRTMRQERETVNASFVSISHELFVDAEETVDEDELQAHFEKYREQTPGAGALDFGYLIPDRVRVQYIKINSGALEPRRTITPAMARSYWQDHREEFPRPQPQDDGGEVGPRIEDEKKSNSPYYERFEEARPDVMAALREAGQLEQARVITERIRLYLIEPWYAQTEGEDGYRTPPAGVADEGYYATAIETLRDSLGHAEVVSIGETALFTQEQAADQADLGAAQENLQNSQSRRAFRQFTHQVQGLVDLEQVAIGRRDQFLALFQTFSVPLIDGDNNLYLFRVISTEESHPPRELAEVRDQTVADLRTQHGFEKAKTHAEKVLARMDGEGLQQAWESYDGIAAETKSTAGAWFEAAPFPKMMPELLPGLRYPVTITDKAGVLPNIRRADDLVGKVYELLEASGPQASGVIEVPGLQKCFVVSLDGLNRVTSDKYDEYKRTIRAGLIRGRIEALKGDWFSSSNIQQRANFKPASS